MSCSEADRPSADSRSLQPRHGLPSEVRGPETKDLDEAIQRLHSVADATIQRHSWFAEGLTLITRSALPLSYHGCMMENGKAALPLSYHGRQLTSSFRDRPEGRMEARREPPALHSSARGEKGAANVVGLEVVGQKVHDVVVSRKLLGQCVENWRDNVWRQERQRRELSNEEGKLQIVSWKYPLYH